MLGLGTPQPSVSPSWRNEHRRRRGRLIGRTRIFPSSLAQASSAHQFAVLHKRRIAELLSKCGMDLLLRRTRTLSSVVRGWYWVSLIVIPSRRNFRGEESSGATVGTTFHCRSLASLGMTSGENIKLTHHPMVGELRGDEEIAAPEQYLRPQIASDGGAGLRACPAAQAGTPAPPGQPFLHSL